LNDQYQPLKEDLIMIGELLANVEYEEDQVDCIVEVGKELLSDVEYLDRKMFVLEQILEVYERHVEVEQAKGMPRH
tara:strand:- start:1085 stop:1312 length:228 start_codon:yes stop_codon:yes gene_type:complete